MVEPYIQIGIPTNPPSTYYLPVIERDDLDAGEVTEMRKSVARALRWCEMLAERHAAVEWPQPPAPPPPEHQRSDDDAPRRGRGQQRAPARRQRPAQDPDAPFCRFHRDRRMQAGKDGWFCSARERGVFCDYVEDFE